MTTECVERRAMRSDDVLQLHYMRDLIAGLSYQSVGDAYVHDDDLANATHGSGF